MEMWLNSSIPNATHIRERKRYPDKMRFHQPAYLYTYTKVRPLYR